MDLLKRFAQVSTFVFDVDGVLTDGSVLLLDNGVQARSMNIKDGLALQMALKHYRVAIISGSYATPVLHRLQYLGLTDIFLGEKDKLAVLNSYCAQHQISLGNVLYMGDDLPDMEVLKSVGLPCCPADAVPEVKQASQYIASKNGGQACVREVIEKVLRLQGHWQTQTNLVSQ